MVAGKYMGNRSWISWQLIQEIDQTKSPWRMFKATFAPPELPTATDSINFFSSLQVHLPSSNFLFHPFSRKISNPILPLRWFLLFYSDSFIGAAFFTVLFQLIAGFGCLVAGKIPTRFSGKITNALVDFDELLLAFSHLTRISGGIWKLGFF